MKVLNIILLITKVMNLILAPIISFLTTAHLVKLQMILQGIQNYICLPAGTKQTTETEIIWEILNLSALSVGCSVRINII